MDGMRPAVGASMTALTDYYRAISNNLANADTAGYKRTAETVFERAIYGGADTPANTISDIPAVDHSQGSVLQTGRPLDLALAGEGFFVLDTTEGPRYTRHSTFMVSPTGQVVDSLGRTLAGAGGPISIPSDVDISQIHVAKDGSVTADGKSIGQIEIVEFDDVSKLVRGDATTFLAGPGTSPTPAEKTIVNQGFQERSNVSIMRELTNLTAVARLYEANARSLRTHNSKVEDLLRAVSG